MSPNELILMYGRKLLRQDAFHTGEWHAVDTSNSPAHATRELLNVSLQFDVPPADHDPHDWNKPGTWGKLIRPNLPWAEEHFLERVSGQPYNPAPSHVRWPWAHNNARHQDPNQQFSHTYPERFWPAYDTNRLVVNNAFWSNHGVTMDSTETRVMNSHGDVVWRGTQDEYMAMMVKAGNGEHPRRRGIRYYYGDLMDVVDLLDRSLYTRQAYLPVWFPEDTGSTAKVRVPCTLGYHFIVRPGTAAPLEGINRLHLVYYIRSCDYVRHFRDDVYMAGRLSQWMSDMLTARGHTVFPDSLTMHITSLHSMVGDDKHIRDELKRWADEDDDFPAAIV